jgi:phage terminase large subunit-like protein
MAITHSRFLSRALQEKFQGPVIKAKRGVKSRTIVHDRVKMFDWFLSNVVTKTTGPGSRKVNAF